MSRMTITAIALFIFIIFITLVIISIFAFAQCWPDSLWYGERVFWAWATGMCE